MKASFHSRLVRGASLVEIIVSAVIIGTCLVAVFVTAGFALKASVTASEKTQAAFLLEGGIDAIKFLRDISWDNRIVSKQVGQSYCLDFGGGAGGNEFGLASSTPNRVLHVHMEEASGTLVDSSGKNPSHPGTPNGTISYAQSGVAGTNALQFNGTDAFVSVADHADFDMGSFTLEAWIKTASANTGRMGIVSQQGTSGVYWRMALGNSMLEFGSSLDTISVTKGVVLNDNLWHHVVVVRDITSATKTARWYVDGKLVATQNLTSTASYAIASRVTIGAAYVLTPSEYFTGLIDEVAVFSRALTDQEIYEEYAAGSACKKIDEKFSRTVTFKDACREPEASTFNISAESTINGTCSGSRIADPLTKLASLNVAGGGANVSTDMYLTKMFLCSYL